MVTVVSTGMEGKHHVKRISLTFWDVFLAESQVKGPILLSDTFIIFLAAASVIALEGIVGSLHIIECGLDPLFYLESVLR